MIVQGRLVSDSLKEKIIEKIKNQKKEVCFVLFGENLASKQFIKMKCRFAEDVGVKTYIEEYPSETPVERIKDIILKIVSMNYSGVVIQLPLPKNINTQEILDLVPVEMDIDVLSEKAVDLYKNGYFNKVPPVARAVDEILKFYNIELQNKEILILGKGRLVGEPVANMLKLKGLDFAQTDINTPKEEQEKLLKNSDVIVSGIGQPNFIKPDMIREGVVIIDAGTSESEGRIVGDVDPACFEKSSLVTPVPGGVGPVTLASLFLNL